jgi:uncharacterized protein (TIGR03437 family)
MKPACSYNADMFRGWAVCLAALLVPVLAQQTPLRLTADKTVYVRVDELIAIPKALASSSRAEREVLAPRSFPLSGKDRWELYPLQAIHPAVERWLQGPAAAAPSPRTIAPSTPRTLTGFRGGLDDQTVIPPDTHGAVGPNHVLTVLNNDYQVQRRDGTLVFRVTGDTFFDRLGPFSGSIFDPRAAYDATARRWVIVALADAQQVSSSICLAVSQTEDPAGAWTMFRIRVNALENLWFDYPNLAIAGDRIVVSVNLFARDTFSRSEILVFTASDLYAGRGEYRAFRETRGTPVAAASETAVTRVPVVMLGGNALGLANLAIGEIQGTAGAETYNSNAGLAPAGEAFGFAPSQDFAPQLNSASLIAANDARIQNCQLRGSSLWCTHHIFLPVFRPERAAVQFYEINTSTYQTVQRGRVEDPTNAVMYAFPSIAVNRDNDVLLGFSRFTATEYAAAAYAIRRSTDPPGQLQADAVFKRGEAAYLRGSTSNRWGDYSAAVVDPADGVSFWTIQEYAASTTFGAGNRWGTWWARITPTEASCEFSWSSTSLTAPAAGGPVSLTVTAAPSCPWMAAGDAGWITIPAGNSYAGTQTLTIQVGVNPATTERAASVTVAGRTIPLTQVANPTPPATRLVVTTLTVPSSGRIGESLLVTSAVANRSDVPSGRFRLGLYFGRAATPSSTDVLLGSCTINAGLAPGDSTSCGGRIAPPVTLPPGQYFVLAVADDRRETTMTDRSEASRATASPVNILPAEDSAVFTEAAVVHGAAAVAGPLSPGQVVVIYGERLGPDPLRGLELDATGRVSTSLAATRVLFDGVAAPMIYASARQVSCVVPYSVAGRSTTEIRVETDRRQSAAVTLPVLSASPGIFTVDFTGRGQGAILNQDSQPNSASLPADRGSVVQIYATGGGALSPPGVDGALIGVPLPSLTLPVEVTIGGQPAAVQYAGPAPGLVSGIVQVNAVVPATVAPGASVPVTIRIGGVASPAGVTLAVR